MLVSFGNFYFVFLTWYSKCSRKDYFQYSQAALSQVEMLRRMPFKMKLEMSDKELQVPKFPKAKNQRELQNREKVLKRTTLANNHAREI